jgi:N-formylglutamate amidohydrolase
MKSVGNKSTPDGDGAERADFVLGDLRGLACDTEITECVANRLRELSYTVAVNDPYQGGDIIRSHGEPASGIHSLQIEINRSIYMDEDSGQKTANFARLSHHLTGPLLERLVELMPPGSR